MGASIQKCCKDCMKLQLDQFTLETRYMQITGNYKKSLRCRKFYISSQPLQKQKINQLIIFTDSSLTMSIPNFSLKLKQEQLEKLQEAVKYQVYNNNLIVRENCFVLNAIEEEIDSQYGEFRQFQERDSSVSVRVIQEEGDKQKQNDKGNINVEIKQKQNITNNNNPTTNNNITQPNKNQPQKNKDKQTKQKLHNEIQQFTLRTKSRAFRFKNPLKTLPIQQIIVAIVPVFQKITDLNILKQSIQQALSMSQDMKSVGLLEISFMLGYQQTIFQKIVLEYILGYSRSRREYVFKRMSQFVYMTRSNQQIGNFFNLLNVYVKNKLEKIQSVETLGSQKERNGKNNVRKLGNNVNNLNNNNKNSNTAIAKRQKPQNQLPKIHAYNNKTQPAERPINQPFQQLNTSGNTSFHSYTSNSNLIGLQRQQAYRRSSYNSNNEFFSNNLNVNDISEIRSGNSDSSEIKNMRVRSFRSKESNVSDYF